MRAHRTILGLIVVLGLACSAGVGPASASAPAKKKVAPLSILVSNDDGVHAEGIDVLVEALRKLPKVKITVSAPADDQTGQGDKTSESAPGHEETTTLTGRDAIAVDGYPADSVSYALNDLGLEPDVVVTGINNGPNLSSVAEEASGTVGAAKTAVRAGVPALAVSQGVGEPPDYKAGAREAIKWVKQHRKALSKGEAPVEVANLNVPTCAAGHERGVIEVPLAPKGTEYPAESDCQSTVADPKDDIEAFANGFATLSVVPAD